MVSLVLEGLLGELRNEGYFTHTLNREEGLYQARKDDKVINIFCSPTQIDIHAPGELRAEIKSNVMEVAAHFEQFLTSLRAVLHDDRAQFEIVPADLEVLKKRESVAARLPPDHIAANLKATTKEASIAELVDLLCAQGAVKDREGALRAVLDREHAMSTGLGHGIATPHGRTDAAEQMVCALGVSRPGIDFGGMDNQPVHLVLLTLFPTTQNGLYVSFLAAALATLNNPDLVTALLRRDSAEAIHMALARSV
jgi:mannitol/fructose-specific phosphotransferase system IIA component (Ntr-type)